MRKNRIFILLVSTVVASLTISCSKIGSKGSSGGMVEVSIRASFPGIMKATKTSLDGSTVSWCAGDTIAVFTESGEMFKLGTSQSGSSVVFKGLLPETAKELTAIYPVFEDMEYDGGKVSVSLPHSQHPVPGGFDSSAAIIVAKGEFAGENTTLNFEQACGLVRFEIVSDDVKKVEMNSPAGKFIVGSVDVPYDGDVPEISFGMRTISVTPAAGKYFEKGVYYISVWPTAVMNGTTLVFDCESGSQTKKLPSGFFVGRGKIWIVDRVMN